MDYLSILPNDILLHILLQKLHENDWWNIRLVNKYFYSSLITKTIMFLDWSDTYYMVISTKNYDLDLELDCLTHQEIRLIFINYEYEISFTYEILKH